MKRTAFVVLSILLAPPLFADVGQHLIPAGSLVTCTTGDARISSRNTAPGDPVLCKVARRFGNTMLPFGSVLGGTFSAAKEPGHFVGKGYMQLDFDRLYVGDNVIPIDAKVVDVPGYRIDNQGRIIGKGHAVRDTITWMIPILWPIDLINLPRRGPRPTLKAETPLTLRVMEDIQVPDFQEPQRDPYGLIPRGGQSYAPPPEPPAQEPQPAPQMAYDEQPQPDQSYAPQPDQGYAPPPQPDYSYAPPPPPVVVAPMYVPPPPVMIAPPPVVAYGAFGYGPGYVARGYAGVRPYYGSRPGYAAPRPYGGGGYRYGYQGPRAGGGMLAYGGSGGRLARPGAYGGGYGGGSRGAYGGGFRASARGR